MFLQCSFHKCSVEKVLNGGNFQYMRGLPQGPVEKVWLTCFSTEGKMLRKLGLWPLWHVLKLHRRNAISTFQLWCGFHFRHGMTVGTLLSFKKV